MMFWKDLSSLVTLKQKNKSHLLQSILKTPNILSHTYTHTDLGHDVNRTHQELVQVSVHHQLGAVNQGIFEARPDLPPQLCRNVQFGAQVSETHAGQVVELRGGTGDERQASQDTSDG